MPPLPPAKTFHPRTAIAIDSCDACPANGQHPFTGAVQQQHLLSQSRSQSQAQLLDPSALPRAGPLTSIDHACTSPSHHQPHSALGIEHCELQAGPSALIKAVDVLLCCREGAAEWKRELKIIAPFRRCIAEGCSIIQLLGPSINKQDAAMAANGNTSPLLSAADSNVCVLTAQLWSFMLQAALASEGGSSLRQSCKRGQEGVVQQHQGMSCSMCSIGACPCGILPLCQNTTAPSATSIKLPHVTKAVSKDSQQCVCSSPS
jgi:hypothetical protein